MQIGDLFAKLGQGQTLSVGEIETLRLEMNRLQQNAGRLDAISAPTGGLDPNVFRNSGEFSVFPMPVASMRYDTQAIATGTSYAAPTVLTPSAATWYHGVVIDTANAKLQVTGQPGQSVLLFVLWWSWTADATGNRALRWTDNSGNEIGDIRAGNANFQNYLHVSHVRKMASADTWYQLQVWQNSGGNLNGDGLFCVFRLR